MSGEKKWLILTDHGYHFSFRYGIPEVATARTQAKEMTREEAENVAIQLSNIGLAGILVEVGGSDDTTE